MYAFNRADEPSVPRELPSEVLSELMLNLALSPFWFVDLCRPWHDKLVTTDASPSYGFGVAVAGLCKKAVRTIGRRSHDPAFLVRLNRHPNDPIEKPRRGNVLRLALDQAAFKPVLSLKAKHVEHSGGMEMHGLALGMQWLARQSSSHEKRVVFLVDATVVRDAAKKGRTSAPTLKAALRRCGAIALACDWDVHLAYIPSESNPSDWPSRGLQYHRATNRYTNLAPRFDGQLKKRKRSRLELALEAEEKRQAWLHRWCIQHWVGENAYSISCQSGSEM